MKKVLFITAFVPSDFTAGEKTTKIMLNELSQNYDVDLIYFKYKEEKEYIPEKSNIKVVRSFSNSLSLKILNILLFPFVHPLFSVRFNWKRLFDIRRLIKEEQYECVVCNYSQTFLYAKFLDKRIPFFLYSMDVIAQRVSRTSGKLIQYFCRKSEKYCMNIPNSYLFSVSKKDCQLIKDLYGLPSHAALAYIEDQILKAVPEKIDENSFVFMGNWKRNDNLDGLIWFFNKVAPIIDFDVVINIVGKYVPDNVIGSVNPHVKVNVLGFVDNPYPLISNCRAFLSPLFSGAGVKQKVFEAMACGTPVIGNEIAFEGIDTHFGAFMLRFKNENEFVECMKKEIPLKERIDFKNAFSSAYRSKTIPQYIKEIVG